MDRLKLYLLRVFKNEKFLYHKTLRFINEENNQFKFSDLTNKGKFISINKNEFPEYSWEENGISYKRIVTIG